MFDIYGTDIKTDFSFSDGDINIVKEKDNLQQSICNRLNSTLDTYSDFYVRYGGNLMDWLGEINHRNTHQYIKIEVESILSQDPRIEEIEADISKEDSDIVKIDLKLKLINSDEIVSLNFVIQEDLWVKVNPNAGLLENIEY